MQGAPFSLQLVQSSPLRGLRGLKLFPTSTAQSEQVRPLYCLANSWIFALFLGPVPRNYSFAFCCSLAWSQAE